MIQPISIFYYNDTHGNSDNMGGLFNAAIHSNATFRLSGGDNFAGGNGKRNGFVTSLMNYMHIDASAIGNHELDANSDEFCKSRNNINYIATNVKYSPTNSMNNIPKSKIIEKNGVKYGFIGTMPLDFDKVTKGENQKDIQVMNFQDSVKALQTEIDKLTNQGIDKIIMLSHSGYETDKEFAKNLDGVDIIIGGHTHTIVDGVKDNLVTSKSGEPVIITQAGENGNYYGELNAVFENGVITKVSNRLTKTYTGKNLILESIKNSILGPSPKVTTIESIEPMPNNRRNTPCAWTEVLADSMKEQMNTDIAIINSPNIRKVPFTGTLTERDIFESAPMNNDLLVTTVTEKQLVEAIKVSSKQTMTNKEGKPGLLIPAGFTYTINNQGDLLSMCINDREIDINNPTNKEYTACYDIFVARADGEYPELAPKGIVKSYNFDKDKTASEYLRGKDKIVVKDDGRIQIVKPLNVIA